MAHRIFEHDKQQGLAQAWHNLTEIEPNLSGLGKGITPGSFLTYVLRGKAKQWAGSYRTSLCRSLQTAVSNGLAIVGPSHGGKEAFYPKGIW